MKGVDIIHGPTYRLIQNFDFLMVIYLAMSLFDCQLVKIPVCVLTYRQHIKNISHFNSE